MLEIVNSPKEESHFRLRNVHSEEPSVRYSNLEDGRGPMDTSSTVTTPGGTERVRIQRSLLPETPRSCPKTVQDL